MRAALILTLLALAGCGADGEPVAPGARPADSAVSISGEAAVGVTF